MITRPESSARDHRLASLGILAGGALWGLYWVPHRMLAESGLSGVWPGMVLYSGLALVLLPFALLRLRQRPGNLAAVALTGLLSGAAFSFYSTAVMVTDVARALLLFYLTPIWGTALGIIFLRERLIAGRVAAIVMALGGLVIVVGPGASRPFNLGDALSLVAGVSWAFGTLRVHRMPEVPVWDLVYAFMFGSLAVTAATLAVAGPALGPAPSATTFARALLPGAVLVLYILPMLWLTIWPARVLSPGRVGLLLMSEVVVGIATAALFAGEPFGPREMLATALIIGAALVELLARPQSRSPSI